MYNYIYGCDILKYDIVIIGGGPAGSTFARLMSNKNLKIALINGLNERHKKPCGGLISPDAQKSLECLKLSLPNEILVSPQLFSVRTIDIESKLTRYYKRNYINVDRYLFDKWLLSLVPETVDIINSYCYKIEKHNDKYLVKIKINDKELTIETKYLVGADGSNSIVRNTFFKNNIKSYMAIQEWFIDSKNSNQSYSCIFDKTTSSSCSWSLNKNEYLIYGGCFEKENAREKFEIQKERVSKHFNIKLDKPFKKEACLTLSPRKLSDFCVGNNTIFLIGEAAGFISPSSFEGISYALNSGKLLSESFNKKNILRAYKRKTIKIKIKLMSKVIKRIFMYNSHLRYLIMKLKINALNIK